MNILRENFIEKLPIIEESIKKATFVAFDEEMNGVPSFSDYLRLMNPEQAYKYTMNTDYVTTQLGLSCFIADPESKQWIVKTFNVYVLKRPYCKTFPECSISFTSHIVDFITKTNFDVNTLFRSGLSYIREDLQAEAREKFFPFWTKELRMETPDEEKLERMFLEHCGVAKIIKILVDAKCPVIGHNMFTDLTFLSRLFLPGGAPESLAGFKKQMTETFPYLIDTKYLSALKEFSAHRSTSLGEMFSFVHKYNFPAVPIVTPEGFPDYMKDGQSHDASYDAFMTGYLFLSLCNALKHGNVKKNPVKAILEEGVVTGYEMDAFDFEMFELDLEMLKPYNGHLQMMSHGFQEYLLYGEECMEYEEQSFILHDFPVAWRTKNIIALFKPLCSVRVVWFNDTCALIKPYDPKPTKLEKLKELVTHSDYELWKKCQKSLKASLPDQSQMGTFKFDTLKQFTANLFPNL